MSSSPYHNAGKILSEILTHKKSLKKVVFKAKKLTCSKTTYAQVCNTLQHKTTLDSILNHNSGYLRKSIQVDKVRNIGLIYILLFELLFGKYNSIRGGGAVKRQIIKMESELRSTKDIVLKENGGLPLHSVAPVFPRYVRINKLLTSATDVIKALRDELNNKECEEEYKDIFVDRHVPDLLCLSPQVPIEWHTNSLVSAGKIVLQDKSSCFSALALIHGLHDGPNGDYIDACAAPGNKTSHLASLIYDKLKMERSTETNVEHRKILSRVYAFDRSSERISILRERLNLLSPPNSIVDESVAKKNSNKGSIPVSIEPIHQDFLKANPKEKKYANVKSILLDPSCSGSGIVNTPDRYNDGDDIDEKRIKSLSNFQLLALKHAMSFDQVVQIVYSTCSVHERENEFVAASALSEYNAQYEGNDEKQWQLISPLSLMNWSRRGKEVSGLSKDQANAMVRVDGNDGDSTNGFFVSYFVRKGYAKNKVLSERRESLVRKYTGVKAFYNQEFLQQPVQVLQQPVQNLNSDSSKCIESNESSQKKSSQSDEKNGEISKKRAKKMVKKLEWKRKQKQAKFLRLKKKDNK